MCDTRLSWGQGLALLAKPTTTAAMLVQCSTEWLEPERRDLRRDIDEVLLARLLTDPTFRVSRLLWHDVPHAQAANHKTPDLLHRELTDWVCRLTASSTLVEDAVPSRLQTLRLIERENTATGHPGDGLALLREERWHVTDGSSSEMSSFFTRPMNTTPILWTSLELDGPTEDLDVTHFL
ncbi:MAG: hypothetical protein NVS3B26_18160 [Mycobacteriales bacterium]